MLNKNVIYRIPKLIFKVMSTCVNNIELLSQKNKHVNDFPVCSP